MVNFGPLAAEILSLVWGTPANFNGFRVLAALLHGSSGRQPNFAALNRGRYWYSAGQPSRWASATFYFFLVHGQVTIIFVVSVGLFGVFLTRFGPILIKVGHMLYVWV